MSEGVGEDDEHAKETEEALAEEIEGMAGLSLNSLMGIASFDTMKLKETLGNREVLILIDSGALHNFLIEGHAGDANSLVDHG